MRFLAVLAAALAVVVSIASTGVTPASGAAAACPRKTVPAPGARWSAAQRGFGQDFARIRTYLLDPTLDNQLRMYQRVDSSLFQYYSFEAGLLNSNRGKPSGRFTWQFKTGSQCFARATKTISFQVLLRARFKSTNHRGMIFVRAAHVEMKGPKITRYQNLTSAG
jgi:hypothetical protein